MKVIAGTARGMNLATPQGRHTRPTTGRIKETLFNIIQADVPGSRFLDLYSGSGSIAIEALSRGAREAVFVDNNKEALACINENIKKTRFGSQSQVMPAEVMHALKKLDNAGRVFDIIFMDPPYGRGFEKEVTGFLLNSHIVEEGTLIIIETMKGEDIQYIGNFPCKLEKVKEYKTNQHIFLRVQAVR
ncbi:MAG: 16S rRNA (guanine(966)-N(2))-methyltransferase RsmD [Lachnospiraceae bacterium]|nr:16S rRNA (guanine(966)-N(2))-methyltransferase RsmD [Lachnospiraceae bacterium]